MKKIIFYFILLFILLMGNFVFAQDLSSRLKGKILLQVENNGEAWYVNPQGTQRYYMGRPSDAFVLMRKLGIGITNENLNKIQIADENLLGDDNDRDGLSNIIEDSIGTDKNKKDSDGDTYNDKDEILNGYNPMGNGKNVDNNFASQQSGKILLQVENNGEAWYVNPQDIRRYFLGKPKDAFNLMRKLGLGIKNSDLNFISKTNEIIGDSDEKTHEEECNSIYSQLENNKNLRTKNDICFMKLAEEKADINLCEKVSDSIQRMCYNKVAIKSNNIKYCESSDCYQAVAREIGDITICENIRNQDDKDGCYAGIASNTRDDSVCEKINSTYQKNNCFSNIALLNKDENSCTKLEKEDLAGWYARDYCYINLMKITKNYKLCEKVNGEGVGPEHSKAYCYQLAVGDSGSDISLCPKLDNNGMFNDNWCYYSFAVKNNDISICDNIEDNDDQDYKINCLKINRNKDDSVNCDNLIDENDRSKCVANVEFIEKFKIAGSGMEPNYEYGDIIYINKNSVNYNRGDVVVIRQPDDENNRTIKRIVGLPGETIQIKDGKIIIYKKNNVDSFILEENYLERDARTYSLNSDKYIIGDNKYYVLGDNRNMSKDSRSFGAVNYDSIIGRVMKVNIGN